MRPKFLSERPAFPSKRHMGSACFGLRRLHSVGTCDVTPSQAEVESGLKKHEQQQQQLQQTEKEAMEAQRELAVEIEELKGQLSADRAVAAKREHEFFEQVTLLNTELEALQKDSAHRALMSEKRDKEYIQNSIELNTEKETLRTRNAFLQVRGAGEGGGKGQGCIGRGGGTAPPSRAPSLCPATVSLTPSASFNGHL